MAVLSTAEVVTMMLKGASVTSEQLALINMLLRPVQGAFEKRIGTRIEQRSFTEYLPVGSDRFESQDLLNPEVINNRVCYPGARPHGRRLTLGNTPLRSVTSLYWDILAFAGTDTSGAWGDATQLTEGQDFYGDYESPGFCRSGDLIRICLGWSDVPRSIKVIYQAGYSAAELLGDPASQIDASALRLALLKCMAASFNASLAVANGAVSSEHLGDWSAEYIQDMVTMKVVIPRSAMKDAESFINYGRFLP